MKSTDYKIYLLSMLESLVYNKKETDLGDYLLEYRLFYDSTYGGDMVPGDSGLAIATRLVNKESNLVEYGNLFFKKMIKGEDYHPSKTELTKRLDQMLSDISNGTVEDKMAFILRPERRFRKIPFIKDFSISSNLGDFFSDLRYFDYGMMESVIGLGGPLPDDAKGLVDDKLNELVHATNLDQQAKSSKKH